jgi:glycosyltransferase involved in cell wall biosynthesis
VTDRPLVTVVASCYNHARFVRDCLESIRSQTYDNVQLIIMDDQSTDGSVTIIDDWLRTTGVRAQFIAHADNRGICRTRNEALSHAVGEYCAFVSTDDVWVPDKLETHVAIMEAESPEVAVLYTDAYRMDESGAPVPGMFLETYLNAGQAPPSGDIYEVLLDGNFIPSLTTLVRRAALLDVGPYDESLSFEDWDMWLRLAQRYRFAYAPVPVARYRIVATSLDHMLRGPRRASFDASKVRIQLKHLGYSPAWDRLLSRRILEFARSLYQLEHPERDAYIEEIVTVARQRGLPLLALRARWAVPHPWVWRGVDGAGDAQRWVRRAVSRARRRARGWFGMQQAA